MIFTVGISRPQNDSEAFGLIVPALNNDDFGCVSAADTFEEIPVMARDAILSIMEEMINSGKYRLDDIQDQTLAYRVHPDYIDYPEWMYVDVNLDAFDTKQKRINIVLPNSLIKRIDNKVNGAPELYRDRSHFLAEAARHELTL